MRDSNTNRAVNESHGLEKPGVESNEIFNKWLRGELDGLQNIVKQKALEEKSFDSAMKIQLQQIHMIKSRVEDRLRHK